MPATIKIKNSSTTGSVPSASNLVQGELAVNVTDLGLYTENASGTVVKLNAPSIDDKNTGATKHLTIDTSGNLGLGVTPSAWTSPFKVVQGGGSTYTSYIGFQSNTFALKTGVNHYYNGSNYVYTSNGAAARFDINENNFNWNIGSSGTAGGTVSFTQAMTLDASGNLLVGTTSQIGGSRINFAQPNSSTDMKIGVSVATGTNAAYQVFVNNTVTTIGTENSSGGSLVSGSGAYSTVIANSGAYPLSFGTNNTERARIDSSGQFFNNCTGKTGDAPNAAGGRLLESNGNQKIRVAADSQAAFQFYSPTGGTASPVGTIVVNTTSTAYNTSSDYRLKNITGPVTGAKDFLMALQPKQGTWKVDGSPFVGFLAHEFQEVSPSSVSGTKDAVDADGNPIMQAMQASSPEVMANLVAYIHELEARLAAAGI